MSLINREALYEKACGLEAQALAYVGKIANDETRTEEWRIWSAILAERTAFKHDVFDAPEVQPEQRWIPVSEKLPEEAQECWITVKDGTVCQGMFTRRYGERRDSGFICYGCGFAWLNAVSAWMPYELPEPYREEGD